MSGNNIKTGAVHHVKYLLTALEVITVVDKSTRAVRVEEGEQNTALASSQPARQFFLSYQCVSVRVILGCMISSPL